MKRTFVSTVLSSSMLQELYTQAGMLQFTPIEEGIEALKGVEFISALKDEATSEFLQKRGIDAKFAPEEYITLFPGDVIYMVNPKLPREARKTKSLPEHTVIQVTKITAWKQAEFVKQYVAEQI